MTAAKWAEVFSLNISNNTFSREDELDDFLGQILHESGMLESIEENLNYSTEGLLKTWPSRFTADLAKQCARNPIKIAGIVYDNRMGNTKPGDGWKYRGRGLIQVTGKTNYEQVGKILGIDLVSNPDLLKDPTIALKSAIAWWEGNIPDSIIGDVVRVSKRVNGGTVGLAHRTSLTEKAGEALA